MKQFFYLALIFVLSASIAQAVNLKEVHSSVETYESIEVINIEGYFCKIVLSPSSSKKVTVNTLIKASKQVEGFGINSEKKDRTLTLTITIPTEHISTKSGEIILQIPSGCKLSIKTSSGYIEAANIQECTVDAHALYGKISADKISGHYNFKTTTGTVIVSNLKGSLQANSRSGNIEASGVDGEVTLITDKGELILKNITGKVNTRSNTSGQSIDNINGEMKLRTSTGEIFLNEISGHLKTNNADGDVSIENFEGTMNLISISGNLIGSGIKLTGNTSFETTKGKIEMELENLENELSFNLASNYGFIYVPGKSKKKKLKSGNGSILITGLTNNGAQRFTLGN